MTTTTATENSTKKNVPSQEIFLVEGEGEATTWTKVGVAFPTKSGHSHRVLVGKRGDPKQKVYLVCPNSQFDAKDNSRVIIDGKAFKLQKDGTDYVLFDAPKYVPYEAFRSSPSECEA